MNAEILVNLNKKRDFYNKFSNLKINDKLSEYIYNESLEGDYNNKVIINITCKEKISDEEKQDMIDIIRKSYGIQVKDLLCTYEKEQDRKAVIELTENQDSVTIKFSLGKLVLKKEGDNYFDTLIKLREELEKLNIKLLCKGCCKNVYPSGMLLCMGAGRNAYTLIYGEQAKMNSLVDIFDSCSIDEYATIQEQLEYFEEWTCSLKG